MGATRTATRTSPGVSGSTIAPWPERAIFGSVRTMTSGSARKKLDFEGYLTRWGWRGAYDST